MLTDKMTHVRAQHTKKAYYNMASGKTSGKFPEGGTENVEPFKQSCAKKPQVSGNTNEKTVTGGNGTG